MNIRTFTLTLALITPCVALAKSDSDPDTIKTPIAATQPLKGPIKATCSSYIQSGTWIYLGDRYTFGEWKLSLVPTECGRAIDESETGLMFYEIVRKFGQSPYWTNNRGMINQLTCHLVIARGKAEWNLEPFRPYVGFNATKDAGCNPIVPADDPPFR